MLVYLPRPHTPTCFAYLHCQLCELALKDGLLLLGHVGFLLRALLHLATFRAFQRLHLHGNGSILLLSWWAGCELVSLRMDNTSVMLQLSHGVTEHSSSSPFC